MHFIACMGGDNPHSATLFQNRITEVCESCSGFGSNINYDEEQVSNLSQRTRFNLNNRVKGQNLYGPGPSAVNLYDNVRLGAKLVWSQTPH